MLRGWIWSLTGKLRSTSHGAAKQSKTHKKPANIYWELTMCQTLFQLMYMYSLLCVLSRSVVSDPLRPHGLQPARLLCPWAILFYKQSLESLSCCKAETPYPLSNNSLLSLPQALTATVLLSVSMTDSSRYCMKGESHSICLSVRVLFHLA